MGLRSPQELKKTQTQALPTARTSVIQKEEMSANFLNTFAKTTETVFAKKEEEDKRMASIISARYRELADAERIKAEGEVAKSQGWNVLNVSRDQSKGLTEKLNSLKSQFDQKYEPYLENVRLDVINKYTRSSQPYVINQVKKTTKDTYNAIIANEMNDTILDSGVDPEQYSQNLDRIRGLVREKAYIERGEDESVEVAPGVTLKEVIDNETGTAVSKTVSNSVIQLAKLGHLGNAESLFRKHDADMNADDRLRAVEAMKSAQSAEESKIATTKADLIQKQASDMVDAEKRASELASTDKERTAIMAVLKSRYQVADQAKKKRIDDTTATIYETLLAPGKTLSDVNDAMRTLPVEKQAEILETINKNNGKVIPSVTNNQKYDEALTAIYQNPEVLDNPKFLASYIPHLSPSDYGFLKSQFTRRKARAADEREWVRFNTDKLLMDDAIRLNNELGVFHPGMASKNKRLMIEYGQTLMEQNPKMDRLELQKKVKAWAYTHLAAPKKEERGVFSKAWNKYFGDGLDYELNYDDPSSPDTVSPDGSPITYSEEDQEEFRQRARKAFQDKGKPVDMLAIEKALRNRIQNKQPLK